MGLKSIFQEGMKERQRRKSLGKMSGELKDKEKAHDGLLTALGQKAWESRTDINNFSDVRSALEEAQKELDGLKSQAGQLQKQKEDFEQRKTQENDRIAAAKKEVEEKKRDKDKRLNEQKNTLENGQKETLNAKNRLAAIATERGQLQNKSADPVTTEAEKGEIARNLELLAKEGEALQNGIACREKADKPAAELVTALQGESTQLQKQIDGLLQEQKQLTTDLDKKISALKNDLAKNGEKTREMEGRLKENFKLLGGKLAASETADSALATEKAAVLKARTEIEGVQALIGGLERQKDNEQVSAYKKMMAIIIGGLVVLAAIVIALVLLLSPKKKEAPFAAMLGEKETAVQNLGELAVQMQKGLGGIKDQSEKIQGKKIVVADEDKLKSILPSGGGWQMQNPSYSQGKFGELETAALQADYTAADGNPVHVEITDAGSASAMLAPVKMFFAMNVTVDNEEEYQKVSVYNDIPVLERYDKQSHEASFGIIVKERYLVELKTTADNGLALLKEFMGKFDFGRLP